MNTRAVTRLAGVICRAQENGRRTPMGIAIAVESAGLLMSPETAAELDRAMEDLTGARLSLWEEEQENARLREERVSTNAALSLAVEDNALLRARVAELEAAAAQRLAADFEAMRVALLAKSHPELAHAALDADDDTAFPLPGVAHPKPEGLAS